MSTGNGPTAVVDGTGLRVAVVAASWHTVVMDGLIHGAMTTLDKAGAEVELFRVPGTFELPVVAQHVANLSNSPTTTSGFDAIVALGVVIRGGTPHFEYVCQAATQGLTQVSLTSGIPIGFGVLTCDDDQQALDRSGTTPGSENKGFEAAQAVLATLETLKLVNSAIPQPL